MSEHACHKCEQPNPWEFPKSMGYQRYEAALAAHRLMWAISDAYHIHDRIKKVNDWRRGCTTTPNPYLKHGWYGVWQELQERYNAPGGVLPTDPAERSDPAETRADAYLAEVRAGLKGHPIPPRGFIDPSEES